MAALGKNSARGALAHADRCARDHPGDIHSARRYRHDRGLYRDSAQRHIGPEHANAGDGAAIIPFATAKELLHLATYTKEKLSPWRQSLVSQHCPLMS